MSVCKLLYRQKRKVEKMRDWGRKGRKEEWRKTCWGNQNDAKQAFAHIDLVFLILTNQHSVP